MASRPACTADPHTTPNTNVQHTTPVALGSDADVARCKAFQLGAMVTNPGAGRMDETTGPTDSDSARLGRRYVLSSSALHVGALRLEISN